jgi:predicted dehydrogenase
LRRLCKGAAGGTLAAHARLPAVARQNRRSETLQLGLVGCGGRGTGAALNALEADGHAVLTAMADLFPDQLETSLAQLRQRLPGKVAVPPQRRFLGFDAFRAVVDSGVDAVLLATPPGFRPYHLAAAVGAGKHAFLEITAGVDAPGVRSVLESAEVAREKRLSIVSGFCWRYNAALRAACRQIRSGAIGEVRTVYATYYRGDLSHHGQRPANTSDLQWQIRDWHDRLWLSGDVTILLSGGHSVDKMCWWLDDTLPTKAVAVGSRLVPTDGNTFDNCFVAYEFPGGVRGFLGSRSIPGCYTENADYIIGSHGTCTIGKGRVPVIEGRTNWRYNGPHDNMYQTEHNEWLSSIRAGRPINDATRMAHTTLVAILGRMAAYTGQEVAWQEALQSRQQLMPERVDWNTKIQQPSTAVPGLTRFL